MTRLPTLLSHLGEAPPLERCLACEADGEQR